MIKKRIIPLLLIFAMLWLTTISVSAATLFSDGKFSFSLTEDDCAIIKDCELTESNIEVPEQLLGFPVIKIGSYAFMDNSNIRSISLPESVNEIGTFAFAENNELETVTIPASCDSIADNAFFNSPHVTIRCLYGSAADHYAREKHMSCEYLDNVTIGDTNGDGEININDVTDIQLHLAELKHLGGINLPAADADQNEIIDIADATALQMYLAEYELPYPIGQPIRIEYQSESA